MRTRPTSTFSRSRRRHFLALALLAFPAGGCASGQLRQNAAQHAAVPQAASSGAALSYVEQPQQPIEETETGIRPVGYGEAVNSNQRVIVQPIELGPTEIDASDSYVGDKEDRSLGDMLASIRDESNAANPSQVRDSENAEGAVIGSLAQDERVAPADPSRNSERGTRQPVEYFVTQALAVHPSIQAARQRVQAEFERIPQVTALPDPQFNNTFWPLEDNAIQTAAGRVANQMTLQQGVPFPDKLRTKGSIVSREAQMAQAEVERIERQITEAVRLAYYEVWYATRAIAIIEESRDLVDDLTKVAEARYRSGGTQQDVLRAQLETDRLDDQIVQLKKRKEMAQADLAALLQQPVTLLPQAVDNLGLSDVPMQLDDLIAQAEQCNPSLRGLTAEIQRDRQKQRLACLQQYPDFMVGLNWGLVSDNHNVVSPVANGNDQLSITFGTTLPIWREKINAGVREASRRTSSTQQRLEAERDEIYGRLRGLLAQADSLVEQAGIYQERIIPRTEDTLKLAIADYRGERTDFFTLIETYRELLMYETQLARIHSMLASSIAQIDRTVGCPY